MLWIGYESGTGDLASHPLVSRFGQLVNHACDFKFLAADFQVSEQRAEEFRHLGIELLQGNWVQQHWEQWLEEHRHVLDAVVFEGPGFDDALFGTISRKTRAAIFYYCAQVTTEQELTPVCDAFLVDNSSTQDALKTHYPDTPLRMLPATATGTGSSAESAKQMSCEVEDILDLGRNLAFSRLASERAATAKGKPVRLITFYLPQYHPIPENDQWWGKGFTEWHNVRKATPLFSGHYQPHEPADLGYYDLRDENTRIAQAELARQYGIEGFCYYHYWFEGKRLLERPIEDLLVSGKPDFPFCLCWANESWTRRWDGKEKDILMKQAYSEQDDLAHIQYLIRIFKDPRYIRVNGKPLLLIYRADSLPDAAKTAACWRREARKAGLDGIYLCRVESFQKGDPAEWDFDASVEFAPDWWNKGERLSSDSPRFENSDEAVKQACDNNFIHSYQGLSEAMLAKDVPAYKWIRCVTPSWDNWARRNEDASVFLDSTPEAYQQWLASCVDDANARLKGDERMVFINAWNEWAEGNHLEPDQRFGHAYLEATKQALFDGRVKTELRRLYAADQRHLMRLQSRLQQLQTQCDQLDQQLGDLYRSTSWRLMAPVRWLKQRLTGS